MSKRTLGYLLSITFLAVTVASCGKQTEEAKQKAAADVKTVEAAA